MKLNLIQIKRCSCRIHYIFYTPQRNCTFRDLGRIHYYSIDIFNCLSRSPSQRITAYVKKKLENFTVVSRRIEATNFESCADHRRVRNRPSRSTKTADYHLRIVLIVPSSYGRQITITLR